MRRNQKYLFGILLIIGLPCISLCQPAVIDSVSVDEAKGELIVYGEFGSSKGFVFVDSLSLQVTFWSDSVCRATIPVSGKGSAGLVEIGARGYRTEGKMLSSIKPSTLSEQYQLQPYFPTQFVNSQNNYWHFRVDVESRIAKKITAIRLTLSSDSRTINSYESIDEKHNEQSHSDTFFTVHDFMLNVYSKIIYYPESLYYRNSSLDSQYKPIYFYDITGRAHSHGNYTDLSDWGSAFLPRPEYCHLTFTPIAFPKDSNYFGNDHIKLFWTESTAEVQYEIQVGRDSSFQIILLDSIVSHSGFNFQDVINNKYFWRVRVKNSVGEGLWSNIARFQYSLVNIVNEQNSFKYSVSPNPASTKTIFSITLPQEEFTTLKIFNTLGNEIATIINKRLPAGDQHIEFDASHLPSGVYYYRLQIGEHIETKSLILAH